MTTLEILSQPLWQQLTVTLLHFVWQGAVIGLCLALCLVFARRAHTRYSLALLALGMIMTCPLMTAAWQARTADVAISSAAVGADVLTATTPVEATALSLWQPYVLLVWLFGVSALSARLVLCYLSVRRLRTHTQPLDAATNLIARRLRSIIRVSKQVEVRASLQVRDALVVGLWRPLVLVPISWLTELEAPVLEAVLAHELAHVRRHDLWVNLLQRVVETLLFYHPAVWYVSRVLRVEREKCCDELAVAATGEKVKYVEALELVARRRLAASPSMWAAAMGGARKMNLLDRVRNVLGQSPTTTTARYWPVGVAALIVPAGLWCASLAFAPVALAQEEKPAEKPREERVEGERREEGRERLSRERGERREEDRPRLEGERREEGERRDGDRPPPREGERREGERREEARQRVEGERRDGDRPPPREGERRDGVRTEEQLGEPRGRGPRPPAQNLDFRQGNSQVSPELRRLIAELREEVGQLRREVRELRAGRGPEGGPRGPEGDRPREGMGPGRGEGRPEGEPGRGGGGRPGFEGPRPGGPSRGEGDRPRGEGERRPEGPREEGERRPLGIRLDGPGSDGVRLEVPAGGEGDRPAGDRLTPAGT